eukprot:PITA_22602
MDLRKLNDACVHDTFPTPFIDKVLANVGSQEAYSFIDGFFGYHQIKIAPDYRSKTTFVIEWGCFQYIVMPFVFGLVKHHVASLRLMLDTFRRYHILLNIKKCLFCVPFWILVGHVVWRQGLMVDSIKIAVIINLDAPRNVKQLHTTLVHTRYYRKFIKSYAQITAPMEKLLKKDATFCWNDEFHKSLDVLKEKMVITPILVFPD